PRKLPMVNPAAKATKQVQSLRFCITLPMANSQMVISKVPRIDARTLRPRDTEMIRTVEMVTTHVSATKMTSGRMKGTANSYTARPPNKPRDHRGGRRYKRGAGRGQ